MKGSRVAPAGLFATPAGYSKQRPTPGVLERACLPSACNLFRARQFVPATAGDIEFSSHFCHSRCVNSSYVKLSENRMAGAFTSPAIALYRCISSMGMMPWPGFEPGCLAALPPQDSVSTSFTTRAGFKS